MYFLIFYLNSQIIDQIITVSKPTLAAIARLIKFLMTLIICLHFFACAFVNIGWAENGWVSQKEYLLPKVSDGSIYLGALYWAITTFATIGYGDFTPVKAFDYVFTMGVYVFFLKTDYESYSVYVCFHIYWAT